MSYAPNTKQWKPGDLVLASGDAKRPEMLMVVLEEPSSRKGWVKLRYLLPRRGWGTDRVYEGPIEGYHDPRQWLSLAVTNINAIATVLPEGEQRPPVWEDVPHATR